MFDDEVGRRAESARLIYQEAVRLRDLQDRRVDDVRQRSITVLSLVSSAVVIVVGLSRGTLDSSAAKAAAAAVGLMILSGVFVHLPAKYIEGPNIEQLVGTQYSEAHPIDQVMRDLGTYHYDHYLSNNHTALRRANWGFRIELVFAAAAVISVLVGVSV